MGGSHHRFFCDGLRWVQCDKEVVYIEPIGPTWTAVNENERSEIQIEWLGLAVLAT
jgi:hypothetical protein